MEQVDPEHDHEALNSNYTYDIVMRTGSSTSVAKDQAGSNNSRTSNGNEVKMECIGCIVCKLEKNRHDILRGYIAMLAIRHDRRKHGLASTLVTTAIQKMFAQGCEEVVLEAEHVNGAALKLYEKLGFVRDKLLEKYYLNGSDAYRLKLKLDPNKDWGTDLQ